jgi:hypothetical protein
VRKRELDFEVGPLSKLINNYYRNNFEIHKEDDAEK